MENAQTMDAHKDSIFCKYAGMLWLLHYPFGFLNTDLRKKNI